MDELNIPLNYFLDETKPYIIPFIPEEEPTKIEVTYKIFKNYFPNLEINYKFLQMSNIGLYSIAKPSISEKICKIIIEHTNSQDITVTDALANVGGMTIMFALYFKKVYACEIVKLHCDILKNNLEVYNVNNKVSIINDDYINIMNKIKQDVIFFDPPWGGRSYKNESGLNLGIDNINITWIINNLLKKTKFIFLRVPYNFQFVNFIKTINQNAKIKIYKIHPYIKFSVQFLILVTI